MGGLGIELMEVGFVTARTRTGPSESRELGHYMYPTTNKYVSVYMDYHCMLRTLHATRKADPHAHSISLVPRPLV
jgi:hypothetical protein